VEKLAHRIEVVYNQRIQRVGSGCCFGQTSFFLNWLVQTELINFDDYDNGKSFFVKMKNIIKLVKSLISKGIL